MRPRWLLRFVVLVTALIGSNAAVTGASAPRAAPVQPMTRTWAAVPIASLDGGPVAPPPLPGWIPVPGPPAPSPTPPSGTSPPSPAPAPPGRPTPGAVHRPQRLSNESTFTRWAYVAAITGIRARPNVHARRVTRLHGYTEDGFPEIYLLLRSSWDRYGREWVQLRIPMRPNGRVGWVPRSALGAFHLTHELIVVNRRRERMYLFDNGHRRGSAPVGVGAPQTPTPAGHFWIRERFRILNRQSGYYPYALGTSDYSTLTDWPGGGVVGIHGPYYQPQLIPGDPSHGCMRLRVSDDAWLARHVSLGTPVHVA